MSDVLLTHGDFPKLLSNEPEYRSEPQYRSRHDGEAAAAV
jgi:hypothetical protein